MNKKGIHVFSRLSRSLLLLPLLVLVGVLLVNWADGGPAGTKAKVDGAAPKVKSVKPGSVTAPSAGTRPPSGKPSAVASEPKEKVTPQLAAARAGDWSRLRFNAALAAAKGGEQLRRLAAAACARHAFDMAGRAFARLGPIEVAKVETDLVRARCALVAGDVGRAQRRFGGVAGKAKTKAQKAAAAAVSCEIAAARGRSARSLATCKRAVEGGADAAAFAAYARLLLADKATEKRGLTLLKEAWRKDAAAAGVAIELSRRQQAQGKPANAAATLKRWGDVLDAKGDVYGALRAYERALAVGAGKAGDLASLVAKAKARAAELDAAVRSYREVAAQGFEAWLAEYLYAEALRSAALGRLVEEQTGQEELSEAVARACGAGRFAIAAEGIRRLDQIFPKYWGRFLARGVCAAAQGKLGEADKWYGQAATAAAVASAKGRVAARRCLLSARRDPPPVVKQRCEAAVATANFWGYFGYGRILLGSPATVGKATTFLEEALKVRPGHTAAARLLLAHYAKVGQASRATALRSRLAQTLRTRKRYQAALAHYLALQRARPDDRAVLGAVAGLLDRLGNRKGAIEAYRKAAKRIRAGAPAVAIRVALGRLLLGPELEAVAERFARGGKVTKAELAEARGQVLEAVGVLKAADEIDPGKGSAVLRKAWAVNAKLQPKRRPLLVTSVDGKLMHMEFGSWGGLPRKILLKKKKYREKKGKKMVPINLVRTHSPWWLPLVADLSRSTFKFPSRWDTQYWEPVRWDNGQYRRLKKGEKHKVKRDGKWVFGYRWPYQYEGMAPPEVVIDRIYEVDPDDTYAWSLTIKIRNNTDKAQKARLNVVLPTVAKKTEDKSFFSPMSMAREALCRVGEDVRMRTLPSLLTKDTGGCLGCDASTCACRRTPDDGESWKGRVHWAAIDEMYFLFAAVPEKLSDGVCSIQGKKYGVLAVQVAFPERSLASKGAETTYKLKVFTGPKLPDLLKRVRFGGKVAPELQSAVDYGFFKFLGAPMLALMGWIQGFVGNWGIAIIILTIFIKLLTAPLTHKQMRSMKAMSKLKPEMDKLKEKYGDDKQRLQQETLALYRSHGVNPLLGCLPLIIQMPIYIAWYQALLVSVDLYNAPLFGWITDLTKPDTVQMFGVGVPILPIILGAAMFLQAKMTPTTAEGTQAKVMQYMMPAMFTFILLFLPSGLTLYILTNTVLSMIHQWYMNHTD